MTEHHGGKVGAAAKNLAKKSTSKQTKSKAQNIRRKVTDIPA